MIKSIMRTLVGNAPLLLITLLVVISLYKFLKIVWNNFFAFNECLDSKFPRHGLGHSIKPVRISNIRPLGVLRGQSASEALSSRVESFKVPEQTGAFFLPGWQRESAFEEVSSRVASGVRKVVKLIARAGMVMVGEVWAMLMVHTILMINLSFIELNT